MKLPITHLALVGAVAASISSHAQNARITLEDYDVPTTIISGSATGTVGRTSTNAFLLDNAGGTTFQVFGATGSPNAATTTTYSATVLSDSTANYLRLRSTRSGDGGNPVAQVSTASAYSLASSWNVSMGFSASAVPDLSSSGAVYMGLYAGSAMNPTNGGYTLDQIANGNAPVMGIQMAINSNGSITVNRAATGNVLQYFTGGAWSNTPGVALSNNTFDFSGTTRYSVNFGVNATSGLLTLSLLDLSTSMTLLAVDTEIAALGTNITSDGTLRFSAGDIASNTTFNYDINVHSLEIVPEPSTIAMVLGIGLVAFVISRMRRGKRAHGIG